MVIDSSPTFESTAVMTDSFRSFTAKEYPGMLGRDLYLTYRIITTDDMFCRTRS
jgi:hypothetical protein